MADLDLARVLDANANRAREGLRTAEDFVRFILGGMAQAENLRALRQGVTKTLCKLPGFSREALEARSVSADPLQPENWKDVLRRVERESHQDVALRGLKRAQEALRVLEEFVRGKDTVSSEEFARLRYQAYEAEQWLGCCGAAMHTLHAAQLMILLSGRFCRNEDVLATAQQVLRGGATVIQFREKSQPDRDAFAVARQLNEICGEHNALLICNDRTDLALASGATGVHLGQDDLPLDAARRVAGRRLLIGRSTPLSRRSPARRKRRGADYIGLGAIFPTETEGKPSSWVVFPLARTVSALKLSVPIFGIGGITRQRLRAVKEAGLQRVTHSHAGDYRRCRTLRTKHGVFWRNFKNDERIPPAH